MCVFLIKVVKQDQECVFLIETVKYNQECVIEKYFLFSRDGCLKSLVCDCKGSEWVLISKSA